MYHIYVVGWSSIRLMYTAFRQANKNEEATDDTQVVIMLHIKQNFYSLPSRTPFTTGMTMLPRGNLNIPREAHKGFPGGGEVFALNDNLQLAGGLYLCPESCCIAHKTLCCWSKTSTRSVRRYHIPMILVAATIGGLKVW